MPNYRLSLLCPSLLRLSLLRLPLLPVEVSQDPSVDAYAVELCSCDGAVLRWRVWSMSSFSRSFLGVGVLQLVWWWKS